MTILVTGGAGFIGANFILEWLGNDLPAIVNIDKLTYAGNVDNLAAVAKRADYTFVHGDIADDELVSQILNQHRPTAVINFAAESHVDRSIHGASEFIQTNVAGTLNLLEKTREYWLGLDVNERQRFRFLHISTDEVYGSLHTDDPAFTESHPYQPNSPYSASKAASDHLVRAYFHTHGLPVLTTNCSNNYGPYQFPEKLIPLVIHHALQGLPLPVYGDGQQIRDWLFVTDHCSAIRRVLEAGKPGEVYNIGGLNEKTNLQVINTLCDLLDKLEPRADGKSYGRQIEFVKDRPGHDRRYAIDAGKIEKELGWTPSESFESGMLKTVQWYLDNAKWVDGVTSGDYRSWVARHYA